MKLDIIEEKIGPSKDIVLMKIAGSLDAHTFSSFSDKLNSIVDGKNYYIIVDFKDLEYISSAGLGVFMTAIGKVRQSKGDIELINLSPKIYKVFGLLGFSKLFNIRNSLDESVGELVKKRTSPETTEKVENARLPEKSPEELPQKFPVNVNCAGCKTIYKIPKAGKFKCTKCGVIFGVDENGKLT